MSIALKKEDYVDYIKLELTGGVIELEIEDKILGKYVDAALAEVRRYIDLSKYITVPFSRCIDLGPYTDDQGVYHQGFKHSSILNVYRSSAITGDTMEDPTTSQIDPMYAQQWMVFSSGGYGYNLRNYIMNYMAYNTLLQLQNTTSTDMNFIEDKRADKLYINCLTNVPKMVTIEYIPEYEDVSEINDDYWIDILKRLSLALVKVALGRIRTRFTQSNALWTQDGETMLQEGNETLKELRETLRVNSMLFLPRD